MHNETSMHTETLCIIHIHKEDYVILKQYMASWLQLCSYLFNSYNTEHISHSMQQVHCCPVYFSTKSPRSILLTIIVRLSKYGQLDQEPLNPGELQSGATSKYPTSLMSGGVAFIPEMSKIRRPAQQLASQARFPL